MEDNLMCNPEPVPNLEPEMPRPQPEPAQGEPAAPGGYVHMGQPEIAAPGANGESDGLPGWDAD